LAGKHFPACHAFRASVASPLFKQKSARIILTFSDLQQKRQIRDRRVFISIKAC
jgi:hypothetical protein